MTGSSRRHREHVRGLDLVVKLQNEESVMTALPGGSWDAAKGRRSIVLRVLFAIRGCQDFILKETRKHRPGDFQAQK